MKSLKQIIHKVLSKKSEIDWLIILCISRSIPELTDVEFSYVDEKKQCDAPFKMNQGYIDFETPDTIREFEETIDEISSEFNGNLIALANLFIIITRASYQGEEEQKPLKVFKRNIGKENCKMVFDLLITSLNLEYYKGSYNTEEQPANTDEWRTLFRSTQYMRVYGGLDPITECLQLIEGEKSRELDFCIIQNMRPLLRAVLIGQYGYDLAIPEKTLNELYDNKDELVFLSACIIDGFSGEKTSPNWLTHELIRIFVEKHWEATGRFIFTRIFGLNHREKQENELYKETAELFHEVLFNKLSSDSSDVDIVKLIRSFNFSDDFIAFFAWRHQRKIDYNQIHASITTAILNQFIEELEKVKTEFPAYFAAINCNSPFNSFQFAEPKYQITFANLFLLLLHATKDNLKDITSLCFSFKPLFYGGFRATSLAKYFTELMLLIGLSGCYLKELEETELTKIKPFLQIIADTVLIPYVHLAEREDEVWNPKDKGERLQYSSGLYLINHLLDEIKKTEIRRHYADFFNEIESVCVARWT